MKVKITGELDYQCAYLTVDREYFVIDSSDNLRVVWINDDDGHPILICTEETHNTCAHMGHKAKAVFV